MKKVLESSKSDESDSKPELSIYFMV